MHMCVAASKTYTYMYMYVMYLCRHVEVQVFGDAHGNYVYLFERDDACRRKMRLFLSYSIQETPVQYMYSNVHFAELAALQTD